MSASFCFCCDSGNRSLCWCTAGRVVVQLNLLAKYTSTAAQVAPLTRCSLHYVQGLAQLLNSGHWFPDLLSLQLLPDTDTVIQVRYVPVVQLNLARGYGDVDLHNLTTPIAGDIAAMLGMAVTAEPESLR